MATKIYCPRCAWAPSPNDRWECRPGCHAVWNTFETRGRCPGCRKRWLVTVCLACFQASLHEHWYHDETSAGDAWSDAIEQDEALVEVGGAGTDREPTRARAPEHRVKAGRVSAHRRAAAVCRSVPDPRR